MSDSGTIDLHIKSGTKAVNSGYNLGTPYNVDKEGVARPQGSAYDRGAYEFK